jgi:hypothetical protein
MFRTRQLVLDPPTEINAASSISARACLRLSSIFQLLHPWSQSKVKLILVGTTNENSPDGGHRAGTLAGLVRDTVRTGELGDGAAASRFLSDTIETMIRQGQRSRLALSNRAIAAFQRFRLSAAPGCQSAVRSSA